MTGPRQYWCSLQECGQRFKKRSDLDDHMIAHEESSGQYREFISKFGYVPSETEYDTDYVKVLQPGGYVTEPDLPCETCGELFFTHRTLEDHKAFPSKCSDAFQPHARGPNSRPTRARGRTTAFRAATYRTGADRLSSIQPSETKTEDGVIFTCPDCHRVFVSMHLYKNHFLSCEPTPEPLTQNGRQSSQQPVVSHQSPMPPQSDAGLQSGRQPSLQPESHLRSLQPESRLGEQVAPPISNDWFQCDDEGCGQVFGEILKLQQHKLNTHGIGIRLDNEKAIQINETLRAAGLFYQPSPMVSHIAASGRASSPAAVGRKQQASLHGQRARAPGPSAFGKKKQAVSTQAPKPPVVQGQPTPPAPAVTETQVSPVQSSFAPATQATPALPSFALAQAPPVQFPFAPAAQYQTGGFGSGFDEHAQAEHISPKMIRMQLQTDVVYHHAGAFEYSDHHWSRVSFVKQAELEGMFSKLVHLREVLQHEEYCPRPKALRNDDYGDYSPSEFELSPESLSPKMKVVAIACSKVVMADGRLEAVKLAAVDVFSCRILLNHLVCMSPPEPVQDWKTRITGLSSYHDLEAARGQGYKIVLGWEAARTALWTFIDRDTIIVGYDLRSDLDVLRMCHGRAVDIAKVIEKSADGPLSKPQISLGNLCKDLLKYDLPTDKVFGRDPMINALTARELALWKSKHEAEWSAYARAKSLEYQRVSTRP